MNDFLKDFRYSVAIRTLGKAGVMYQRELDSLNNQTIKPEKIIVYIAEGYEKPKETIGWEQIVYVKKGMVAQRALQYDEINSPYILLLDDDVHLPADSMEKLAKGIIENNGDCIGPDVLPNHTMSIKAKIRGFISNWACPIYSKKWALITQHTGSYCYNNNPTKDIYLAQSVAGPCSLWKKDALLSIHYEDELWLDKLGFAFGDDMLFSYKLYLNGGKILFHYTTGIQHLDAQSSRNGYNADLTKFRKRAKALFILWWRIDYDIKGKSALCKVASLSEYILKFLWSLIVNTGYSILKLTYKPIWYYLLGNIDAYKFVHSEDYKTVPNFKLK